MSRGARSFLAVASAAALSLLPQVSRANEDRQAFGEIERGAYLAVLGDCTGCHTEPGATAEFAGGRPVPTPFGNVVAPNITPDPDTGIGTWSDQDFVSALTQGVGRGGKHLYPAMPYTYFTKLTREDALAIRAYLNTVPAVHNAVRANRLPFPFNIRAGMAVWNRLFFKRGPFTPNPAKNAEWNRGAYLAEGPMHCGMCHTPKNFMGGDKVGDRLQGYSLQGWFAPDITNDQQRGLGKWSIEDIVSYLKTGHNRFASASGPMGEEVEYSSAKASDADLHAVAAYLKDVPGEKATPPAPVAATDRGMKAGAAIYADECSACHGPDGRGEPGLFPALAGSASVMSREPTSLARVILHGTQSVATPGAPTAAAMPAFGWLLTDGDVAAVVTYIRNSWGNAAPAISAGQVSGSRKPAAQASD